MMVETRPVGCGLFGFGLFWLSLFFSPPSDCSSLPSTMTWAPCPHGVRTRRKLVTIAGTEYATQADLSHYEDVAELEDDILCFLPTVSDLDVFGCELDLLDLHTQQPLPEGIPQGAPATTATTNCSSFLHGGRTFHLAVPERRQGKLPQSCTCPGQPAPGCLSSTGITALALTKLFAAIGAHACDSCRLLKSVDLCNTNVEEIPEFTHCTSLREVLLPTTLHTIRVKAFMNCAALVELAIPPSLRYIGSRAFLGCTVFKRLAKMPGRHKWRGVYAEENAFAICPAMRWPPWLHIIPDMGKNPWSWMKTKPFWPQLSRSH